LSLNKKIRNLFFASLLGLFAVPVAAQVTCNSATEGYLLDWNTQNYTAGSRTFSSAITRIGTTSGGAGSDPVNVGVGFTGVVSALESGQPVNSTAFTGGKGTTQRSLSWINDFVQMNDIMTITITFAEPVYNLRFEMFDMDLNNPNLNNNTAGGFRDTITVTGYSSTNATVLPALTTPYNSGSQGQTTPSTVYVGNPLAANRAIANSSNNNGAAGTNEDLGNVIVTFSTPVQRVTMDYGTRSDYFNTSNPARQAMALYDLSFCKC